MNLSRFEKILGVQLVESIAQEYREFPERAYEILVELENPPEKEMRISTAESDQKGAMDLPVVKARTSRVQRQKQKPVAERNSLWSRPQTQRGRISIEDPQDDSAALPFIQSCFPTLEEAKLADILKKHANDPERALAAILDQQDSDEGSSATEPDRIDVDSEATPNLPLGTPSEDHGDGSLAQLVHLFPKEDVELLQACLAACDNQLQQAIDMFLRDDAKDARRLQRALKKQTIEVNLKLPRRPITEDVMDEEGSIKLNSKIEVQPEELDIYRHQAQTYSSGMRESFAKAAKAFNRKERYSGAIAAYYSQQGHEYNVKRQEANMKAAVATVMYNDHHLTETGGYPHADVLDLHHVHLKEALMILKDRLMDWYRREAPSGGRPRRKFVIITGVGRHSERGSKLQPAVYKYLAQHGWNFDYDAGCFTVKNCSR